MKNQREHSSNDGSSEDMGYESHIRISMAAVAGEPAKKCRNRGEPAAPKRLCVWRKPVVNNETLLIILTIVAVLLGILLGFLVRQTEPSDTAKELIKFPGEILMRGLKMMILPVIITSIVTGLANLDMKKSGRIGTHAMVYYVTTTTIAVLLGIFLVSFIHPGGTTLELPENNAMKEVSTLDTYLDLVRNVLPENIIAACFELVQTSIQKEHLEKTVQFNITNETIANVSDTSQPKSFKRVRKMVHNPNILGVIAFFVAFGVTLSSLGEDGKPLTRVFHILNEICMKMIKVIIWYSPVGICFLIATNVIELGNLQEIGETLGMYMLTVCSGLLIHAFVILPLIYFIFTRSNPYKFAYGVVQPLLTALGTSSSAATLPITMRCLEQKIGIDERVTKFVLPIGATMNMDGTALLEGVASITIAQMHGIPLSAGQILTISITATVASVGAAAIPSAGLVTLILVLTSIGIPTESVVLLWSIDWLLDRLRTAVNVFGDCVGAAIVYHKNKHLLCDSSYKMDYDDGAASASGVMPEESTELMSV